MTQGAGNHAVRSDRWRYIRYKDGSEELYDHSNDPWEWTNLAGDPRYADVIADHKRRLPKQQAAPGKSLTVRAGGSSGYSCTRKALASGTSWSFQP